MARLTKPAWEKFAQGVAKGATYTAAYIAAGYKHKEPGKAAHLLIKAQPTIRQRVDELRAKAAAGAEGATQKALNSLQIEKEYVLKAAVDTLEMALSRKKVQRTRAITQFEEVDREDDEGNPIKVKVPKVATIDFEAYQADLPVASKMVELLGREHSLFIETKRVQTGPLDKMPTNEMEDALDAIRAAIAKGEKTAKTGKPATPAT